MLPAPSCLVGPALQLNAWLGAQLYVDLRNHIKKKAISSVCIHAFNSDNQAGMTLFRICMPITRQQPVECCGHICIKPCKLLPILRVQSNWTTSMYALARGQAADFHLELAKSKMKLASRVSCVQALHLSRMREFETTMRGRLT